MKPINVGLLGIGTVGGGTFPCCKRNQEEITPPRRPRHRDHHGGRQEPGTGAQVVAARQVTDDAFAVVADPEIDIVVELIGGYGIAKELVLEAIENGKHVVTANKALLAVHGNEIFAAAPRKGVMVAFEAAVAGGIPIIKALREGLTANRIEWIAGIINGTTNFILSEMRDKGLDFDDVLKEAQRLGYAEADPTFDIEGVDAAHKATIMSAIAFGIPVQFDKAHIEGITKLQTRPTSSTPSSSATASSCWASPSARDATAGHRAARASDADPGQAPDRQRRRRDERRAGAGRRRRHHAVLRQGRRRRADRQRRDRRPGRRHPPAHRRPDHRVPHLAFQPDQLADLPILPIERGRSPLLPAPAVRTSRACWPTSPASWPIRHLDRRHAAARARRGRGQTDIIILTHDALLRHPARRPGARRRAVPARALPAVDDATLRLARLSYADLAFEILSLYIDDIPPPTCARCATTYTAEVFGTAAITPLRRWKTGSSCEALSNGPTLAFKDMAMQLLGQPVRVRAGARGEQINILGRHLGDTGSGGRIRHARQAGRARLHALAARPHERLPAAQMYSLQDANIFNIAVRGMFDDARTSSRRSPTTWPSRPVQDRHRQLDQLGARAGAGGLLLQGLLPGDEVERRAGSPSPCRRATSATSAPATSRA
jgi:homoserine dehydrogenase